MTVLSEEKRKKGRAVSILPKQESDGSHSVYLTVTGLTEREALIMADMLTANMCGEEIKAS